MLAAVKESHLNVVSIMPPLYFLYTITTYSSTYLFWEKCLCGCTGAFFVRLDGRKIFVVILW